MGTCLSRKCCNFQCTNRNKEAELDEMYAKYPYIDEDIFDNHEHSGHLTQPSSPTTYSSQTRQK